MAAPSSVEQFWAARLGCSASDLTRPRLSVVRHPQHDVVYVFATERAIVVAAPDALHARLRAVADPRALVEPVTLRALVPTRAVLVGPARIAYLYRALAAPAEVVSLGSPADSRLEGLRGAVTAEEWRHANLEAAEPPLFGCEVAGRVATAAGFERLLGFVAHIGVVTDPGQRARGLGRRVVEASAAHAQALGLLPQYQTLASNAPSLRVAEALGFEPFATTLAARWSAMTT